MYRSIVVGTDGSETAHEAVAKAAGLAALCQAKLLVVSAYRPVGTAAALAMSGAAIGMVASPIDLVEAQLQEADEILAEAVRRLGPDVRATTRAVAGEPAEVLLQVAQDEEADLIVVGSRGMQGASRFLLGSVPNRVAHHAKCSVLIVHTC